MQTINTVTSIIERARFHTADWRDALETVINSRKLPDILANPSTQRKRYYSLI